MGSGLALKMGLKTASLDGLKLNSDMPKPVLGGTLWTFKEVVDVAAGCEKADGVPKFMG